MLTYTMMDQALRAIAEPHRREILRLVLGTELSSGEIAAHFEVTRPAISQHLRVLTEAGLLTVRAEGTRRLYSMRPDGLAGLKEYLEQFWEDRLRLLAQAAEAEERRRAQDGDEPAAVTRWKRRSGCGPA